MHFFTKRWGEAKHDPMLVTNLVSDQGGFCGGYDPGDSLVCDCGLETLRKSWRLVCWLRGFSENLWLNEMVILLRLQMLRTSEIHVIHDIMHYAIDIRKVYVEHIYICIYLYVR